MTDSFEVREKRIEKNSCLVGYVMFGRTVQERTMEDWTVVVYRMFYSWPLLLY